MKAEISFLYCFAFKRKGHSLGNEHSKVSSLRKSTNKSSLPLKYSAVAKNKLTIITNTA